MADFLAQCSASLQGVSGLEMLAVVLALVYLWLAIKQNILCWLAAFVSSLLYVMVLYRARLYMESVLNIFYALMAAYGFWQWRSGAENRSLRVRHWPGSRHMMGLAGALLASLVTSYLLRAYTLAAWPFVDSMVTWTSVFATFLVARKVYENWHWWLVIDSVALYLYFTRHLYPTMLLFGLYLVMIFLGMREWRKALPERTNLASHA